MNLLVLWEFILYSQEIEELSSWTVLKDEVQLFLILEAPVQLD